MKKFSFLNQWRVVSLSSITGFSQISVMHYPQHKEGWLVMQNQENVYSRWTVLGFQVLKENHSLDTIPKDVFELVGKNYFAMPEGIMVHQFLFSDGSVKTVTGLKVSPY